MCMWLLSTEQVWVCMRHQLPSVALAGDLSEGGEAPGVQGAGCLGTPSGIFLPLVVQQQLVSSDTTEMAWDLPGAARLLSPLDPAARLFVEGMRVFCSCPAARVWCCHNCIPIWWTGGENCLKRARCSAHVA